MDKLTDDTFAELSEDAIWMHGECMSAVQMGAVKGLVK